MKPIVKLANIPDWSGHLEPLLNTANLALSHDTNWKGTLQHTQVTSTNISLLVSINNHSVNNCLTDCYTLLGYWVFLHVFCVVCGQFKKCRVLKWASLRIDGVCASKHVEVTMSYWRVRCNCLDFLKVYYLKGSWGNVPLTNVCIVVLISS